MISAFLPRMCDGMATSSSTSELAMPFLTSQNPLSDDMKFVDILWTNSQFPPARPSIAPCYKLLRTEALTIRESFSNDLQLQTTINRLLME